MFQDKKVQLYQFDVLRAIAIIGVFLVHSQYAVYPNFDLQYGKFFFIIPQSTEKYKYLAFSPFAFGWVGVTLFFLISGFLIHYNTLRKGVSNFSLKLFFSKRFWRIYPLYFFVLIFFTFSNRSLHDVVSQPQDFLAHLFLYHNFNEKYIFSINGAFWSLAAEAQMYLMYPLFLFLCLRKSILFVIRLQFFLGVLIILYWWYSSNFESIVLGNSVFKEWFIWGLGAYLGECYNNKKQFLSKTPIGILIILILIFYISKATLLHNALGHYLAAFICAICIEKYLYRTKPIQLWEKILTPIGLCSYSIYLVHMPFLARMFNSIDFLKFSTVNIFYFLLINIMPVFIIILLLSYTLYSSVELKTIKLGDLIYKRYFIHKKMVLFRRSKTIL